MALAKPSVHRALYSPSARPTSPQLPRFDSPPREMPCLLSRVPADWLPPASTQAGTPPPSSPELFSEPVDKQPLRLTPSAGKPPALFQTTQAEAPLEASPPPFRALDDQPAPGASPYRLKPGKSCLPPCEMHRYLPHALAEFQLTAGQPAGGPAAFPSSSLQLGPELEQLSVSTACLALQSVHIWCVCELRLFAHSLLEYEVSAAFILQTITAPMLVPSSNLGQLPLNEAGPMDSFPPVRLSHPVQLFGQVQAPCLALQAPCTLLASGARFAPQNCFRLHHLRRFAVHIPLASADACMVCPELGCSPDGASGSIRAGTRDFIAAALLRKETAKILTVPHSAIDWADSDPGASAAVASSEKPLPVPEFSDIHHFSCPHRLLRLPLSLRMTQLGPSLPAPSLNPAFKSGAMAPFAPGLDRAHWSSISNTLFTKVCLMCSSEPSPLVDA